MRVNLKKQKSIMEQVSEARAEAEERGREIDSIELTRNETYQLANELAVFNFLKGMAVHIGSQVARDKKVEVTLLGVSLVYNPEDQPNV